MYRPGARTAARYVEVEYLLPFSPPAACRVAASSFKGPMESEGQPASSDGPAPVPPMLKWAQRRDRLFITLDVQDVTGAVVSLSEDALVFSGQGCDGRWHEMNLSFYKPVDPKHPVGAALDRGVA